MKFTARFASVVFIFLSQFALTVANDEKRATREDSTREAQRLWEQAVAAKGGRGRLSQVESFAVYYEETWRNFLWIPVHRGPVVSFYVFPDKFWYWSDEPALFKLTVSMLDLERNISCVVRGHPPSPHCTTVKVTPFPEERMTQPQYLYLLETKWVKPVPVSVSRDWIGLKPVDVVTTRVDNRRVDYFLDRKTHLPRRVAIFYGERAETYNFSEYVEVNGIMMPGKQKRGRINFEINPAYDENLFLRKPSVEAGPDAWRKVASPTDKR